MTLLKSLKVKYILEFSISKWSTCMVATFLNIFLFVQSNENLLPTSTSQNLYEKCFRQINKKYFQDDQLKLALLLNVSEDFSFNGYLDGWIVQTNIEQSLVQLRFQKVDTYLILSSSYKWQTITEYLSRETTWNPRAKYVIISEENPKYLFEIFSKHYIYNIVVLQKSVKNIVQMFSYFPYTSLNVALPDTNPVLLDICKEGMLQNKSDVFPDKLPKRWSNTTLRITVKEYPPYTIVENNNNTIRGIEIESLDLLKSFLDFKTEYATIQLYWGMKLPNGTYLNALGDVQSLKSDIAVGAFHAVYTEQFDFDLSFAYMEDSLKWIVPAARPLYAKNVMLTFSTYVWISIVVSLIITACMTRLLSNTSSELRKNQNIWDCLLMSFQSLLNNAGNRCPKSTPVRIVFAIWCLATCVFSTAFQSKLLMVFSSTPYEKQVASLKDILETDMKFGFYSEVKNLFERSSDPREALVLERFVNCDPSLACLNETLVKRNLAVMKSERCIESILPSYLRADGSSMLYIFKTGLRITPIQMFFTKGYPMFEQMDKKIIALKSAGFIDHFYKSVQQYTNRMLYFNRARKQINSKILNYSQLESIFIIWFIGILASLTCFLLEQLTGRFAVTSKDLLKQKYLQNSLE